MLLRGQLHNSTFSAKGTFWNCYSGEIGLHMKSNFNRLYLPVDKNCQAQLFTTKVTFLPTFWGYRGESGGVLSSNVPRQLLINPCNFQEFPIDYITADVFCLLVKDFIIVHLLGSYFLCSYFMFRLSVVTRAHIL